MDKKTDERRKFRRINFDEDVNVTLSDETHDGCRIKNMSLGGMFITGYPRHDEARNCRVSLLHKSTSEEPHFQASATVVWENEDGVGIKFTSMTRDSYMLLLTKLINNANQPATIMHGVPRTFPFEIAND